MIGLTLFGTYTTAESILSTRFESPAAIYVLGPFISGACAGAAQSLLSAPLDNARHLLLRRQRFLRQTAESLPSRRQRKRLVGSRSEGLPFTSWWSLLRDSVFSVTTGSPVRRHPSSGDASMAPTSRRERLERARSWARRGWSFLGLSVAKDSLAFGTFFVIFEVGREGARRVGLVWDNIDPSLDSDGASDRERQRRSASGLILQSLLILVSGGIAGWVFSLIARPFERVRAAVYEGRARWAHGQSSRTSNSPTADTVSPSLSSGARRSLHPGRSKGSASERRSRAALKTSGRKKSLVRIGHLQRILRRRPATSQHSSVRGSAGNTPSSSAEGVRPPAESVAGTRNELAPSTSAPTATELVGKACRQYGVATFLFAPRSVLQAIEARQRLASALPDEGPTATLPPKRHVPGPTRLSARGRQATQSMTVSTSSRMLRVGGSILRFGEIDDSRSQMSRLGKRLADSECTRPCSSTLCDRFLCVRHGVRGLEDRGVVNLIPAPTGGKKLAATSVEGPSESYKAAKYKSSMATLTFCALSVARGARRTRQAAQAECQRTRLLFAPLPSTTASSEHSRGETATVMTERVQFARKARQRVSYVQSDYSDDSGDERPQPAKAKQRAFSSNAQGELAFPYPNQLTC